ncbi:Cof-type HAD-IIB family hydrolase [Neiella sp. HB171785]|uniref:Cof-type HAD-IIB family hydrolase n=1 Tax=Neiella litorisoli TaxID=2771431 RepID=A0A8J6QKF2_9GAMM|nr:Cof-type HAD-IIB family hydrolase [Neiella litorisoli]MBD1389742.1 Cof-type HAD-IIB family hydrolase [Neiella litorisoli]
MIKAIVSDLDGTLLNADHTVGEYTQRVLKELTQQGMKLILASGRPWADVEVIRQKLAMEIFLITCNGARVHDRQGHCIFRHDIPQHLVQELLAFGSPAGAKINVYQDDLWWVTEDNPSLLKFHADSGFSYQVTPHEQLPTEHIAKVFWIGDNAALKALEKQLNEHFGDALSIAFSLPICLEVMAGGVSKAQALDVVLQAKGLEFEQVIGFGDGLNDRLMLSAVGQAAIMANGADELKQALPDLPVIGSNTEEAVAQHLEQLFLSP